MNTQTLVEHLLAESEAARAVAVLAAINATRLVTGARPSPETLAAELARQSAASPALRDAIAAALESAPVSLRDTFATHAEHADA